MWPLIGLCCTHWLTHSPIDSFLATSKDYKLLSWVYSITKQGAFCNDISCLHNNNEALMDHLIISIKSDLMVEFGVMPPKFSIWIHEDLNTSTVYITRGHYRAFFNGWMRGPKVCFFYGGTKFNMQIKLQCNSRYRSIVQSFCCRLLIIHGLMCFDPVWLTCNNCFIILLKSRTQCYDTTVIEILRLIWIQLNTL